MRLLASAAALLALTVTAIAGPPVPRKSPEFVITDPSGKPIPISSFKGKILVMPLMFTTCPHCQREAQFLTKLQKEFANRGVVMQGTVFNNANGAMASQFVKEFNIGFPVGFNTRDQVVGYLGLSVMDRWVVPQVVIIDKDGTIVAQSAAEGTPELQDEAYIRTFLEKLLKGGGAAPNTSSAAPAPKAVATK
ncbi:MAG: TlpA family protein disulfide reductase [Bryobacterales bacterium]|nr:TlpA family protein disulfide reductase [Bryobacterales bacterium]